LLSSIFDFFVVDFLAFVETDFTFFPPDLVVFGFDFPLAAVFLPPVVAIGTLTALSTGEALPFSGVSGGIQIPSVWGASTPPA
jgi:hypothetical protein